MNHVELTASDTTGPWRGARDYRLACPHGVSSATVLPGAKTLADQVVLDLMLGGHQRRNQCACEPIAQPAQWPLAAVLAPA